MDNELNRQNNVAERGVEKCKSDLSKYFHPPKRDREQRFNFIYRLFGLNDDKIARAIGIDRTTMNRYRRGIFEPTSKMKLLIAQKISKLAEYQIDSAVLFGDDLFFCDWKDKKECGNDEKNF